MLQKWGMNMSIELKGIVEGLLFASGEEGISIKQIANSLDIPAEHAEHIIEELKFDYEHVNRGMMIMQSKDIYHMTTKPEHSYYYKKVHQQKGASRMTQSALETLAIIAYRQPVTKVEIEELRGVNSDYAVQSLIKRSLIEIVGRKDGVGRPYLFGTTKEFLTYFGLASLNDLPPLKEELGSPWT